MTGLRAEYTAALKRMRFKDLAPLRAAGVSGPGLAIGPAWAGIQLSGDCFKLDFESDGFAFVIPVRAENAVTPETTDPQRAIREAPIVDLIAFSATNGRWARRLGNATWAGATKAQYLVTDPTPIWRTPLGWLRGDCKGLVLLTRDPRERYRILSSLDSVLAEGEAHAEELRELLSRPWLAPPVLVRDHRVKNAA